MKIGIDIRTLMDKRYSGVSEYTFNLVNEIIKLDRENEYRLFYNSARDISSDIPKFNYPNVKVIKKSYPNKILNYFLFKCLKFPEIDKFLGVDSFFMPHINFIALSGNKKSILTIHDLSFLRFNEFFSFRKNFWHKMINAKKLSDNFDTIIAVSESTKNDIVDLCEVNPEKVKVIYSGIEEDFRVISKDDERLIEIKNKYKLPKKFILSLGTIEPRKNIEGIISAFNKLRNSNNELSDYKLVIAGARGWKSENIYKKWQKSKYKDDIIFLGYILKEEKVYLYNLSSVFVYPSFYEGFGFPPLEAMASGVPVVTSNISSLPEIVGGAAIMVDPYNILDITKSIEQILSNEDLKDNLIKKGLERAKEFNWEKTAREYLDIFKF